MGLRYIQETTEGDSHHRHDAQFILADISLEDEPQRTDLATELMDRMHARFPDNTLIHHRLIDTRFESGRYEDVLTEASKLAASTGGDSLDTLLRSTAPIWRARAFVQLGLPDRARAELSGFPEGGPDRPHWAGAWVRLTNAQILDMAGERDEALSSYRDVSGLAQPHAVRRAQLLADAGIEAPFVTARVASSLAAQAR